MPGNPHDAFFAASRQNPLNVEIVLPVPGVMSFPAPTRGWIESDNVTTAPKTSAAILENFFPTQESARLRGGSRPVRALPDPVRSLFVWNGTIPALFASTDTEIYDVNAASDDDPVWPPDGVAQTGGDWSTTQISNTGGDWLIGVNGLNDGFAYTGSAWRAFASDNAAITGALEVTGGGDPKKWSHVWNFKERLYFIEKSTFKVWYLGSKANSGAATALDLGSLFEKGGSLAFGATFSSDAGDDVTDRCVFVTTEGEVAIFSGLYPGASDWSLDGRYVIAPPLDKAHFRAGGDLGILTGDGIVSLSNVVKLDRSAVSARSLSRSIQSSWREAAASGDHRWSATMWRNRGTLLISAPRANGISRCFVMNTETGAWCRYTGWDVQCAAVFAHGFYFGRVDGRVMEAENGGQDYDENGGPIGYAGVYVPKFQGLSRPRRKHARFGKVSFKGSSPSFDLIALSDYDTSILEDLPELDALESDAPVNTLTSSGTDPQAFDYTPRWDDGSATWDAGPEFKWDEAIRNYSPGSLEYRRNRARAATSAVYTMQRTTGAMGYALSLALVTEANSVGAPVFEIMASSLQYEECRSAF